MTVIAVLTGVVLGAWLGLPVSWSLSILAIIGSVFLHMAVNVWNDYFDYKYGVDNPYTGTARYRPHPLVLGFMTPRQVLILATSAATIAMIIATLLTLINRTLAILLGALGLLFAYSYTGPPLKLKYRGLGEPVVFVCWGPLMCLGGYYVATGDLSINAILASMPIGLLVTSVLLANNIRDIDEDAKSGARTLAVILGRSTSIKLYQLLITSPYAITLALILAGVLPLTTLAVFLTTPKALNLLRMFEDGAPVDADPRTASLVLAFGLIYVASIAAGYVFL